MAQCFSSRFCLIHTKYARDQEVKEAYETHIVDLKEQIKLLRGPIFGRKSEQTIEPNTP